MSTPHLSPTELLEQYGEDELTGQKAKIPFKRIQLLHGLIVGSEIPARITEWRHAAQTAPGGRPAKIDDTTVLVIMLALALEGSPLLITRMATVLAERLGPKSRHLLGVFGTTGTHAQWYDRIHRCMQSMYAVMDPKPGPRRRRLSASRVKEIIAARDEADSALKMERLDWFTNELIYLSVLLAGGQMDNWHGNMSIDATVFGVFNSRGGSRDTEKTPAKPTDLAPLEYDGWWYFRDSKWGTTGKNFIKKVFGYEAHLIAACTNDGDIREDNFPTLILGLSVGRPGQDVAGLSMRAFNQVDKRHHNRIQGALVIGDRGYFAASQADKLQLPLRALGLGIVTDYKIDQLGIQVGYAGAEMIEGNWYCPSMPENLKNATILQRAGEIDWQTWKNWIASRKKYLLRRHEKKTTPHGATKMKCPAAGPNPTVICPLKELGCTTATDHLKEIKDRDLPLHPDRICTNGTVTFPAAEGAKFRQELQFASPEWDRMYGAARNTIEAANAHLKDDSHEGLAAAGRRRVRGYTAQYVMIAVLVFASNLRRIDTHRKRVAADEQARDPRRFAETSIKDYAPKPPEWWKTGAQRFRRQKAA